MDIITKHFLISGEVQGVGFRAFVYSVARELSLTGWVRNLRDGRVEALAMGPEKVVTSFSLRIHRGPNRARVARVEEKLSSTKQSFSSFEIVTDGDQSWRGD